MKLYQYLHENKIKQLEFARISRIPKATVSLIVVEKLVPSIKTALKIYIATRGLVTPFELLPYEDTEEVKSLFMEEWL